MKMFKDMKEHDKIYVALNNRYDYGHVQSVLGGINVITEIKNENGYMKITQQSDICDKCNIGRRNIIGQREFFIPMHKIRSSKCCIGKFFLFTSKNSFRKYMHKTINRIIQESDK